MKSLNTAFSFAPPSILSLTICHDPGNPWRLLRQSSGVLYYEHPARGIAVSYRAGNADVVSLAVDPLRWIYALFEKKGDVRR